MSFLRPEALETLHRWAEPAVAGAAVLLIGGWGAPEALHGSPVGWVAVAAAVLGLFWLRSAVLGALASHPVRAVGAVVYQEGEIGYMGPHVGAILELHDIVRVEIYHVAGGTEPVWRLVSMTGDALAIPAGAEGAGHLPEALSALPGFSDLAAVNTLQRARPGRHVVWERYPGTPSEIRYLH